MPGPENPANRVSSGGFAAEKTVFLTKDNGKEVNLLLARSTTLGSFDRLLHRESCKCAPLF